VTNPCSSASSNAASVLRWLLIALSGCLFGSAALATDNRQLQVAGVEDAGLVRFLADEVDLEAYVAGTLSDPKSYTPPLMIPPSDFSADSASSNYFFSFSGGYFGSGSDGGGCYMAPVYLPHGVTVQNFFAFLYDNSAGNDVSLTLRRKFNLDTNSSEVMGFVSSSGQSTSVQVVGDTSIEFAVTSQNYSYSVTGCMFDSTANALRIYGVWIFYLQP